VASPAEPKLTWPRLLGAAWSVADLALLWPLCLGLADARNGHVLFGLALVAIGLAGRFKVTWLIGLATSARASASRRAGRQRLGHYVARRVSGGQRAHAETLWAIDRVAESDEFETLRAATGASMLALGVVFYGGGWLSTALVLALLALSVPFYIAAGKSAAAAEETYRTQHTQLVERQLELLLHSTELRGLGAVDYAAREIAALSDREHRSALAAIRRALRSSLVTEFLGGVSVGLVAMVVGFGLLHGHQNLFKALLSVFATATLVGWVRRYGVAFHRREAVASAHSMLFIPTDNRGSVRPPVLLTADNLVTRADVAPLSLSVEAGDKVALLGPSGSGKTTLVETLLGWLSPQSGSVVRANQPIGHVGVASALIPGTVRDNITLGREVADHDLEALLEDLSLRVGLDYELSHDGVGLSTGERVRLVVARALTHGAHLLILDDIAGLLDDDSADALRRTLARHRDLAVIEVAPRHPAIIAPDRVVRFS